MTAPGSAARPRRQADDNSKEKTNVLTRESMRGLYVLVVTPFDDQHRLDGEAYRQNVRELVALGVDGIITTGTNGEFFVTTDEELRQIARITVEESRGKAVAVIGASAVNTDESIRRTRIAVEEGADAVMNVVPFYQKLSKAEAYQYFHDLAKQCPEIGIIVYNNPTTTKVLLTDDDFVELQKIASFCGSKMIGADLAMYINCLRRTTLRHFPLETMWAVSHFIGGNGVMASFIYAFPAFMIKWWEAIRTGHHTTALAMQDDCNRILKEAILPLAAEGFNETALTKA
ncbi:MAG: dihydrodipicolinate synthase family protein, partial [Vicinamibacteraceae bacterium]